MKPQQMTAIVAILCMMLGGNAGANVFDVDDRRPATSLPFGIERKVGMLVNPHEFRSRSGELLKDVIGTAFIVSPCYILTNYHLLGGKVELDTESGPDLSGAYSAKSHDLRSLPPVQFRVTVNGRSLTTAAQPIRSGSYQGPQSGDFALLKMEQCLGELPDVGWLEMDGVIELRRSILVGYFQDRYVVNGKGERNYVLSYDPNCEIRSYGYGEHDCASRPGTSGSPIISYWRDSPSVDEPTPEEDKKFGSIPFVIAMNSGPSTQIDGVTAFDGGFGRSSKESSNEGKFPTTNYSTPALWLEGSFGAQIEADKTRFGRPNPSFPEEIGAIFFCARADEREVERRAYCRK